MFQLLRSGQLRWAGGVDRYYRAGWNKLRVHPHDSELLARCGGCGLTNLEFHGARFRLLVPKLASNGTASPNSEVGFTDLVDPSLYGRRTYLRGSLRAGVGHSGSPSALNAA